MTSKLLLALFTFIALQRLASAISFEPCKLPELNDEAQCGRYEVLENRKNPDGRKIQIKIAVVPATGKDKLRDPLFVFAGGPGQAATDLAEFVAEHFAAIRKRRDLVFVDVRGTGTSNPLTCELYTDEPQSYFGDLIPKSRMQECLDTLKKRADVRFYTTTEIVKDVEEIRAALGYPQNNLYGTSYGTRVALVYLRMYPRSVRSAILDGPAPTTVKAPLYHAWAGQKSIEKIFAECAADLKCKTAFPKLQQQLKEILLRLEKSPAKIEITIDGSNQKASIFLNKGVFAETLRNMLYNPQHAARVPLLIHQAYGGDFTPFAEFNIRLRKSYQEHLAFGLFHSVVCAEDIPFITKEEAEKETRGTFLGDYRIAQHKNACEVWPRGDLPPRFNEPVVSDVPTLIISGELDPVTPPRYGEEVARHLTNSRHILLKGGSHSGSNECVDAMMVEFILSAKPSAIDVTCASQTPQKLEFALPRKIPR